MSVWGAVFRSDRLSHLGCIFGEDLGLWPVLLQSLSGSNSSSSLGGRERSTDDLLLFERADDVEAQRLLYLSENPFFLSQVRVAD